MLNPWLVQRLKIQNLHQPCRGRISKFVTVKDCGTKPLAEHIGNMHSKPQQRHNDDACMPPQHCRCGTSCHGDAMLSARRFNFNPVAELQTQKVKLLLQAP
jgi:hypothetical protein